LGSIEVRNLETPPVNPISQELASPDLLLLYWATVLWAIRSSIAIRRIKDLEQNGFKAIKFFDLVEETRRQS
jgi:hypothetical protein